MTGVDTCGSRPSRASGKGSPLGSGGALSFGLAGRPLTVALAGEGRIILLKFAGQQKCPLGSHVMQCRKPSEVVTTSSPVSAMGQPPEAPTELHSCHLVVPSFFRP